MKGVTGSEIGRVASGRPSRRRSDGEICPESHPVPVPGHSLRQTRAEPVHVRRIKAGISIEELAEDIARRGLLQSLSVRPVAEKI